MFAEAGRRQPSDLQKLRGDTPSGDRSSQGHENRDIESLEILT
jgi:hypothetical protein